MNFQAPKVVFAFFNGVTGPIAEELQKSGVIVLGEIVPVDIDVERKLMNLDDESDSDYDTSDDEHSLINKDSVCSSCKCSNSSRHLQEKCRNCNNSHSQNSEVEQIGNIVSSRQTENLLTDLSANNKCERYLIDSNVNQPFTKDDCTTLNSIDSRVSEIGLQNKIGQNRNVATDDQSDEGNHVTSDIDNMSEKCLDENVSGKSLIRKHCFNLDKWKTASVISFIQSELLLNPLVDFHSIRDMLADNKLNSIDKIDRINLDITALITLVSAVAHGGCYFRFKEKILSEQAAEERMDPVLPKLQAFIEGTVFLMFKLY